MTLLEDNVWINLPPELADLLEDIILSWNLGQFPLQVFTSPPTSSTPSNGTAFGVAKDGNTWKFYCYTNTTDKWQVVSLSAVA